MQQGISFGGGVTPEIGPKNMHQYLNDQILLFYLIWIIPQI